MIYENIKPAVFLDRPNRFIANIEIKGRQEVCHVKNTGRCRELLTPRADIFVQECGSDRRKTKYDLISVRKGERLVNIDSSAPNKVFAEWVNGGGLFEKVDLLKPEHRFGGSRFDFYIEADGRRAFLEVKGVTLEEDGIARFPDAPTERGVRHLNELAACVEAGYDAYMVFVVQMKGIRHVEPNRATHPAFAEALKSAWQAGVHILALDCDVTEDSIFASERVDVRV